MNWTRAAGLSAADIDAKRKEFLAGCGFDSLTHVDRVDGFTKLLKELQVLQGVDLSAAREADDPSINAGRVLRHQILTELVPCLELYGTDVKAYITSIIEDKNRWWKIDRPTRDITIMDLDAKPVRKWSVKNKQMEEFSSPLKQLRDTLSARLNVKRNAAGDTIHDMKIKAGVACHCALICSRANVTLVKPLPVEQAAPAVAQNQAF